MRRKLWVNIGTAQNTPSETWKNKSYAAKPRNMPCLHVYIHDMQKKKPFSPSLCLASTLLLQSPQPCSERSLLRAGEKSRLSQSTAQEAACLARRSLLLPRGPRLGGAGGTTAALQTNAAGLGAGDEPHGAEPQRAVPGSRAPRTPSTSQEWPSSLHSTGRSQGTTASRGCDGALPQVPSRRGNTSQRTNNICPIVTLPAFLQDQGSGVPTRCTYKGTIYFHRRNASRDVQQSPHEKFPAATPRASAEKASQSKIWKCQTTRSLYNTVIY